VWVVFWAPFSAFCVCVASFRFVGFCIGVGCVRSVCVVFLNFGGVRVDMALLCGVISSCVVFSL